MKKYARSKAHFPACDTSSMLSLGFCFFAMAGVPDEAKVVWRFSITLRLTGFFSFFFNLVISSSLTQSSLFTSPQDDSSSE
jgi:hypothetical protein